jgi:hypothetical protein
MWGALSDERTGLFFVRVTVSSISPLSGCTIYILHVIKCIYVRIKVCIYDIYKASISPGSVQQIMPYY